VLAPEAVKRMMTINSYLVESEIEPTSAGIIAGHGRVLAAHVLGLDEVPCIVLAHLTPAQRRAYPIKWTL
jgi:ParB-like chromosome segregation protein Spo0J